MKAERFICFCLLICMAPAKDIFYQVILKLSESQCFRLPAKAYSEPCQLSQVEPLSINYFREILHLKYLTGL